MWNDVGSKKATKTSARYVRTIWNGTGSCCFQCQSFTDQQKSADHWKGTTNQTWIWENSTEKM